MLALGGAVAAGWCCGSARAVSDFTSQEYLLLPVRIHLLRAALVPELSCKLKNADAERILGKINGIWKQAGIQFYAESIRTEEAASQELYHGLGENVTEGHLRLVRPRDSMSDQMFHLYCIRSMRPNGICLQGNYQLLFVKETARLNPVPGGIDEDLPRVCAHEMGHGLGLDHRQAMVNLMASGTTGTSLNDGEIATARGTALGFSWSLKPDAALQRADQLSSEGRAAEAAALYTALAHLPEGQAARDAMRRLQALKSRRMTSGG